MMMMTHQWVNVDLPQTPPDTDNEHTGGSLTVSPHRRTRHHPPRQPRYSHHSNDDDRIRAKYVYSDHMTDLSFNHDDDDSSDAPLKTQPQPTHTHTQPHSHSHTLASYGSDNDDLNSDDALYSEIDNIDTPITLALTPAQVDTFHAHLYAYIDSTRSTREHCRQRYHILCLINDIWQRILIQRELDKKRLPLDASALLDRPRYAAQHNVTIHTMTASAGEAEPYQLDAESVEWLTPCSSPRTRLTLNATAPGTPVGTAGPPSTLIIPSASIFGSICTRLDCAGSDMDITLPHSVDNPIIDVFYNKNEQKGKLSEFLRLLTQRILSKSPTLAQYQFEVFPVLNAKVPIIKLKETAVTGLEMDIAIQSSQQSVAKLVNFYGACDDRVRPFMICVKHWSKVRGLCDAMANYPNSFGFVLLAVKFLQMVNLLPICSIDDVHSNDDAEITVVREVDRARVNADTLLELLVQFFDMYHRFNFKLLQISTSRVGLESKANHAFYSNFKHAHQTTMVVEDPSCRSVNVTRNVRPYRLAIMQNEFLRAYKCCKHGDWHMLMAKCEAADELRREPHIFEVYPPSDAEQRYLRRKHLSPAAFGHSAGGGDGEEEDEEDGIGEEDEDDEDEVGHYHHHHRKHHHHAYRRQEDEKDEEFDAEEQNGIRGVNMVCETRLLEMITEPVEMQSCHAESAESTESVQMSPEAEDTTTTPSGESDDTSLSKPQASFSYSQKSVTTTTTRSYSSRSDCTSNRSHSHSRSLRLYKKSTYSSSTAFEHGTMMSLSATTTGESSEHSDPPRQQQQHQQQQQMNLNMNMSMSMSMSMNMNILNPNLRNLQNQSSSSSSSCSSTAATTTATATNRRTKGSSSHNFKSAFLISSLHDIG